MAQRYHAESGRIIPKMRPARSLFNLKPKHLPMKLPLLGRLVMLPDLLSYHRTMYVGCPRSDRARKTRQSAPDGAHSKAEQSAILLLQISFDAP